jgi:hypothetical protein
MTFRRIPIDTARLATVSEKVDNPGAYADTFVRIKPTNEADPESVKRLKQTLIKAGAKAVRILPRPPQDEVQVSAIAEVVRDISGGSLDIPPVRELLAELVDKSSHVNKQGLIELIERLADEAGL